MTTTPTHVRMTADSREGNPSKGVPIRTVVAAGTVLPVVGVAPPDKMFPHGHYNVVFPDGSIRACSTDRAEPVGPEDDLG